MACEQCDDNGEVSVDERSTDTIRWEPCDNCRCLNCGAPTDKDRRCSQIDLCVKLLGIP